MIIQEGCKPGNWRNRDGWQPQYSWPENCFVQWGDKGVVFSKNGSYTTSFFEAFPNEPKTFIRGEGETIAIAEQDAWCKFESIINCKGHEFERRGYRNGVGVCRHCGMTSSKAFEPLETCVICGAPTYHGYDKYNRWYCPDHVEMIPPKALPDCMRILQELE